MLEDHTTFPPLKGKTMEELNRERMAVKPDSWTMAWLKQKFEEIAKAYLGCCHLLNNAVMMIQANRERIEALEKRVSELEAQSQLQQAKIGEQQVELGAQGKRQDDMAEWGKTIEKRMVNVKS